MKDYWINLPSRIKQNERLRFNYLMNKLSSDETSDDTKFNELNERVRALEDKNGYTVIVTETNGVTGATVKIGDINCTDNNDGTYTAVNVTPATYNITSTKSDYNNLTKSVTIDYQHLAHEITMVHAPHTVSGVVLDDESTPNELEGVTVNILDGETVIGTATTNSSGEYEITDIISGEYSIQAVLTGYSHTEETITVNGEDLTKNITMTVNV